MREGLTGGLEFNCLTDWLELVGHILRTSEGMEWEGIEGNDVRKLVIDLIVEYEIVLLRVQAEP